MLNKMSRGLFAVLILALLCSAAVAFDRPNKRPMFPPPHEKMMERMAKDLGLTKEQKAKYTAMAKQLEEESTAMRSKNKEFFDKIGSELAKDSPNRDLLFGYMQQISKNEDQMRLKRMDQMIQLRKELTPEQKAKLEKLMKQGREKHNGEQGRGPENGPPDGQR